MKVRNQFNGKCFPIVHNASKKKFKQTTSKHSINKKYTCIQNYQPKNQFQSPQNKTF